jgi:hypothetical protein
MATLSGLTVNGTGSIQLPTGTTAQRPASPVAGMIRYNTTLSCIESYNGTQWVLGIGSSASTAATSGKAIYNAYPSAPSGVYWLKTSGGTAFQAYIAMDYGGGWVNLHTNYGSGAYSSPLYGSALGAGGGDQTSGNTGNGFGPWAPLGASYVSNNQAGNYVCSGSNGRSQVFANASILTDLGATQVRWSSSVTNMSNVTCGYLNANQSSITIISGTSNYISVCANGSGQYSQVNPGSFTLIAYANIAASGNALFEAWTACSGSMSVALNYIMVR